jgi:hypothetical protein
MKNGRSYGEQSIDSVDALGSTGIGQALSEDSNVRKECAYNIEYYNDHWDSDNFFVCFDRYHIFVANRNEAPSQWRMLIPESDDWDAVHQRIYRNFRSQRIERMDLPSNLPPPPELLPPEALRPTPSPSLAPILAECYPALRRYLLQGEGNSQDIFLVLSEDTYESQFGDGKFHYPTELFFDRTSLNNFLNLEPEQYTAYHVRKGMLRLNDGVLDLQLPPKLFDHFTADKVLAMADAKRAHESSEGS